VAGGLDPDDAAHGPDGDAALAQSLTTLVDVLGRRSRGRRIGRPFRVTFRGSENRHVAAKSTRNGRSMDGA
jgi:hypothetical protein